MTLLLKMDIFLGLPFGQGGVQKVLYVLHEVHTEPLKSQQIHSRSVELLLEISVHWNQAEFTEEISKRFGKVRFKLPAFLSHDMFVEFWINLGHNQPRPSKQIRSDDLSVPDLFVFT